MLDFKQSSVRKQCTFSSWGAFFSLISFDCQMFGIRSRTLFILVLRVLWALGCGRTLEVVDFFFVRNECFARFIS